MQPSRHDARKGVNSVTRFILFFIRYILRFILQGFLNPGLADSPEQLRDAVAELLEDYMMIIM